MKKIATLILLAIMTTVVLVGCDNKETGKEKTTSSVPDEKIENIFDEFKYNNQKIELMSDVTLTVDALGEPKKYFESPSCAFEGMDKIYEYPGIELFCMQENDKDVIYAIILLDDTISTPEGICLGMGKDDIVEKYGDEYIDDKGSLIYKEAKTKLTFIIEDGIITSIEYVYEV